MVVVPTDAQGRMLPDKLEEAILKSKSEVSYILCNILTLKRAIHIFFHFTKHTLLVRYTEGKVWRVVDTTIFEKKSSHYLIADFCDKAKNIVQKYWYS